MLIGHCELTANLKQSVEQCSLTVYRAIRLKISGAYIDTFKKIAVLSIKLQKRLDVLCVSQLKSDIWHVQVDFIKE